MTSYNPRAIGLWLPGESFGRLILSVFIWTDASVGLVPPLPLQTGVQTTTFMAAADVEFKQENCIFMGCQ